MAEIHIPQQMRNEKKKTNRKDWTKVNIDVTS